MGRKTLTAAAVLTAALLTALLTGCGPGEKYASHGAKVLMEESQAPWTAELEKSCGLAGLGRPYGTAGEAAAYDETAKAWRISFDLDEPVTQVIVDGYAQAVWNACEKTGGKLCSGSGYGYDGPWEARRRQEPLDYYIWYYCAGNKVFRVGLYPSEMEEGRPGGLLLAVQQWE